VLEVISRWRHFVEPCIEIFQQPEFLVIYDHRGIGMERRKTRMMPSRTALFSLAALICEVRLNTSRDFRLHRCFGGRVPIRRVSIL